METDYYCREFTELEIEIREHNKYRAANPLFVENTHRVTVPKSDEEKVPYRPRPGQAKRNKDRYDKCVADGICTECRKSKADRGRMCTPCNEKSKERWSKRSAALSKRRAKRMVA